MSLDAQTRAYIGLLATAGIPPTHQLSVDEARAAMITRRALLPAVQPEAVANVENRRIPGPAGELPIRIYTPSADPPLPLLVFFHGGGWVLGSLDTHDGICRAVTNAVGCVTVSVDYRLAPEATYPAAVEDAYSATCWVAEHAAALSGDADRLAVGGDSAGGNLAAVVSLMARDRGGPRIAHQLLIYPVTNFAFDTKSYEENADGYLLMREDMRWFWNHYLPDEAAGRDPYASPLQATDLRGLPPATILTAEYDPLRDEGEAYAERLREAGVPVSLTRYPGLIHGFFGTGAMVNAAKQAVLETASTLRIALSAAAVR